MCVQWSLVIFTPYSLLPPPSLWNPPFQQDPILFSCLLCGCGPLSTLRIDYRRMDGSTHNVLSAAPHKKATLLPVATNCQQSLGTGDILKGFYSFCEKMRGQSRAGLLLMPAHECNHHAVSRRHVSAASLPTSDSHVFRTLSLLWCYLSLGESSIDVPFRVKGSAFTSLWVWFIHVSHTRHSKWDVSVCSRAVLTVTQIVPVIPF